MVTKKYPSISIGNKFDRLEVKERLEPTVKPSGQKVQMWLCECKCGELVAVRDGHLKSGNTKSCGCINKEKREERNTTHGLSKTAEYRVWGSMIQRCTNSKDLSFDRYGGRGIGVCPEWRESFESFISDMGERPSKNHSIERLDNNGDYSPDNCKWVTATEQALNKRVRSTNNSGHTGVHWNKSNQNWVASGKIGGVRHTLYQGKSKEIAINKRKEWEYAQQLREGGE